MFCDFLGNVLSARLQSIVDAKVKSISCCQGDAGRVIEFPLCYLTSVNVHALREATHFLPGGQRNENGCKNPVLFQATNQVLLIRRKCDKNTVIILF